MSSTTDVQKKDDVDVGAIVATGVANAVKRNPVKVSMWLLGLMIAAFANGFKVDAIRDEQYQIAMQHAEEVTGTELAKAMENHRRKEDVYYKLKGWFSCDGRCQKALDAANIAKAEVNRVEAKRTMIVSEARQEVGIWSTFGVTDVRNAFWSAWQKGKDFASRYTMYDAMFMMVGNKEEGMAEMALKLLFRYIMNLTMGLCGAFFFFIYNVYQLIVSYGEPALSGIAFFLLVLVAGLATLSTYIGAIFGTVAGGGYYLVKQAEKQAKLEGGPQGRRRQVQYGNGPQGFRQPGFGASGFGGPGMRQRGAQNCTF